MAENEGEQKDCRPYCNVIVFVSFLDGLAAATGIRKAGHDVGVVERVPELREIGAGIQVPPNASKILKKWSILEDIISQAVQPHDIATRSYKDGHLLTTQSLDPTMLQTYDNPYLVIHRAEYLKILVKKAKELGITMQLGLVVESIDLAQPSILLEGGKRFVLRTEARDGGDLGYRCREHRTEQVGPLDYDDANRSG